MAYAQHDIVLTQNKATSGSVEFIERKINLPKGAIIVGDANGGLISLGAGTVNQVLKVESEGVVNWSALPPSPGLDNLTGTINLTWEIDSSNALGVKLRGDSGVLKVQKKDGATLANMVAADATFDKVTVSAAPTNGTDVANKAYVDGKVSGFNAMSFIGTLGVGGTYQAIQTPYKKGDTYKVLVPIGTSTVTFADQVLEDGDFLSAVSGNTSVNNADWTSWQGNVTGAVTAVAASVTAGHIPMYSGTTGRLITTSGILSTNLLQKSIFTQTPSLLAKKSDSTVASFNVPFSSLVGRESTGEIKGLDVASILSLIGVEAGANKYVHYIPSPAVVSFDGLGSTFTVIGKLTVTGEGHISAMETKELNITSMGGSQWLSNPPDQPIPTIAYGVKGNIATDALGNYLYMCYENGKWSRSLMSKTWLS